MDALRDVTARARSGRLKSSELGSATMTVSSLGETGVETVFPVIHPPQVAMVGFGAVLQRPWVVDGGLYVRRVIQATLAADHRASDGHLGAVFLGALEEAPRETGGAMNDTELGTAVRAALASVAPEVEDMSLDPAEPIRDQLDIDSMDFLNFMIAVHVAVGVEIPESDYGDVASLDGCVRYLSRKLAAR